jgi:hypothetical protein
MNEGMKERAPAEAVGSTMNGSQETKNSGSGRSRHSGDREIREWCSKIV